MPQTTLHEVLKLVREGRKNRGDEFTAKWLSDMIQESPVQYMEAILAMDDELEECRAKE